MLLAATNFGRPSGASNGRPIVKFDFSLAGQFGISHERARACCRLQLASRWPFGFDFGAHPFSLKLEAGFGLLVHDSGARTETI